MEKFECNFKVKFSVRKKFENVNITDFAKLLSTDDIQKTTSVQFTKYDLHPFRFRSVWVLPNGNLTRNFSLRKSAIFEIKFLDYINSMAIVSQKISLRKQQQARWSQFLVKFTEESLYSETSEFVREWVQMMHL